MTKRGLRKQLLFCVIFSPLSICCEMGVTLGIAKSYRQIRSVGESMEILKTIDLTKHYSHNGTVTKAVDHVNISICKGEYVSIIGQSGAGKSTLLNLVGGLDKPDAGKVFIKGTSIYGEGKDLTVFRRRNIGFIFQSYHLMPFLDVWENMILPVGIDGRSLDKAFASELLERLGLSAKKTVFQKSYPEGSSVWQSPEH